MKKLIDVLLLAHSVLRRHLALPDRESPFESLVAVLSFNGA